MNRRELLSAVSAAAPALLGFSASGDEPPRRPGMGVVLYALSLRRAAEPRGPLHEPLGFLEHCRSLGAGGVQMPLGVRDRDDAARLRRFLDSSGMYLEGVVRLPRDEADGGRFEAEVRSARDCGARVLRTALLNGRRYETFRRAEDFTQFDRQSRRSLALARPVVERHDMVLGAENHKDYRAAELAELIRGLRSARVGVCLDTGNNMSLLERPLETAEALAPLAVTTHMKDMAVEEYRDGFLLAEVPLGEGLVDLPRVVQLLRRARPDIHLNLEMITRDPLRIPCLTPGYWATLEATPARRLAAMLAFVRSHAPRGGLLRVSRLRPEQRVRREEENVRRSLRHAEQAGWQTRVRP
jgi:sugar phosphate isomerase/epimerase